MGLHGLTLIILPFHIFILPQLLWYRIEQDETVSMIKERPAATVSTTKVVKDIVSRLETVDRKIIPGGGEVNTVNRKTTKLENMMWDYKSY